MTIQKTSEQAFISSASPPSAAEVTRRKFKPVKWWAGLGVVVLALGGYSATRWLLGGFAHVSRGGPDRVPAYMAITAHVQEVVFTSAAVLLFYYVVWKPWRRDRRLSTDAIIFLGIGTVWIQDPLMNYTQQFFVYNSAYLNLGCPQCFMPGWIAHSSTMVESPFVGWTFYFGLAYLAAKAGVMIVRWAQSKYPKLGHVGALSFILIPFFVFDILTEFFWIRTGQYVYLGGAGGPHWLILFRGHFYQIPLWEVVLAAVWYTALTVGMLIKDDKGRHMMERGIDEIRGPRRRQTGLRLLAAIGMFNVLIFVAYTLPMAMLVMHWNQSPADIQNRSYFTQGICGPRTTYACPDPRLPVPNVNSARVGPDGKLVAPNGIPLAPGETGAKR
jgi:hypothetical protein